MYSIFVELENNPKIDFYLRLKSLSAIYTMFRYFCLPSVFMQVKLSLVFFVHN